MEGWWKYVSVRKPQSVFHQYKAKFVPFKASKFSLHKQIQTYYYHIIFNIKKTKSNQNEKMTQFWENNKHTWNVKVFAKATSKQQPFASNKTPPTWECKGRVVPNKKRGKTTWWALATT